MTLATAESARAYAPSDLELFERLADRYALALDNARLFRDQQRTAARLQRSLRPRRLPEVPRLDVAAHYQPVGDGAQAGGDFYDLFRSGHGAWVAVLGDVSGKGIDAAASSALMRHTLRAAASGQGRLPRALALADEILHAEDEDRLCSAVLVRASVLHGRARLTLANAGHPPPLVVRQDGTVIAPSRPPAPSWACPPAGSPRRSGSSSTPATRWCSTPTGSPRRAWTGRCSARSG